MLDRMDSNRQSRQSDVEGKRSRGTGFPVVPLGEAVGIVTEAGKYATDFSLAAFAGYMGHSSTNSGAFKQRLAALRGWGLVISTGDRIALSDLGRRVALPIEPERQLDALREAFGHCEVFVRVYDSSAKGRSLDLGAIGNGAVLNLGVAASSREAFAHSFLESAIAAGLARPESGNKIVLLAEPQSNPERSLGTVDDSNPRTQPRSSGAMESASPTVIRQAWSVSGGSVMFELRLDRPLPAQAFGKVQGIAEAMQALADLLGPEEKDVGAAE